MVGKRILWSGVGVVLLALMAILGVACQGAPGQVGPAGPPGQPGPQGIPGPLAPGVERQVNASVTVSKPANGTHFVSGEQAVLTITLKDQVGGAFDRANDFSQLRLMVAGPQEPTETVTAVKLLKTTADRSQPVHHYVDLKTNADVQVSGNTLTYKLGAVSDEKPGTYIASVWAVSATAPLQQAMPVVELQIGTATVEKQIVAKEKCANCHLGADTGRYQFRHSEPPLAAGQPMSWAIDQNAPLTCKTCHNNDGYSAFVDPLNKETRVTDPIVHRVHGIHMGEELKSAYDIGSAESNTPGVFEDYSGVIFPNNVKNCNTCHVDDRFKTRPSQLACGACHDNVWFGDKASMPKGDVAHVGGPQPNDSNCATCHQPDTKSVAPSITEAHKVEQLMNKIDVSITSGRNGKYLVAGEKPVVTLVIRDDNGKPIDHAQVSETTFSTASLLVYGPRLNSVPVLSNAAKNGNSKSRASASSTIPASGDPKGWVFAAGDTFKIAVHGGPVQEIAAPTGAQTPAQVVAWLTANLKDVVVTSNAAGNLNILSKIQGDKSKFEIYNSAVTAKMGWKPIPLDIIEKGKVVGQTAGTTMEPFVVIGALSIPANDLRPRTDPLNYTDPSVTRNFNNIMYQLDDVAGLKPGTYMIYVYVIPNGVLAGTATSPGPGGQPNAAAKALNVSRTGIGFTTFQVGTETPDKKVATNCTNCHGSNIWHLDEGPIHPEPFDTDYCKACHDYNRSGTGEGFSRTGGTSTSGPDGYGAMAIVGRVHRVHRGAYLAHPENVYAGNPNAFSEVIFPQDIRNCSKCHSADTTGTWKTAPSRLACMACHDSDKANTHAKLMTNYPSSGFRPADPWISDRIETCDVCHGAGKEFSAEKVHNISNPYKPPYPREPE